MSDNVFFFLIPAILAKTDDAERQICHKKCYFSKVVFYFPSYPIMLKVLTFSLTFLVLSSEKLAVSVHSHMGVLRVLHLFDTEMQF